MVPHLSSEVVWLSAYQSAHRQKQTNHDCEKDGDNTDSISFLKEKNIKWFHGVVGYHMCLTHTGS